MAAIEYIRVDHIHQHPDNPRKDLGDVSELAESIKANGILQNLTVVPYVSPVHKRVMGGMYTVIIGHRRLAAAKLAGLETVPCVVAEMSDEAQLATMLTENMQRTDLTVYEQAKSFQQLSIDFGMSPADIAAMSGFSEGTVRKRTKLAELDETKFKKACERGATLYDFAELDKITDPDDKEKCLDAIGTNNFKNVLSAMKDRQKYRERREKWLEQLSKFATKIEKQGYVGGRVVEMNYFYNYGSWTRADEVMVPEDAGTVRYFYVVSDMQISVYKERIVDSAEEQERQRKKEIEDKQRAKHEELEEITERHYALRFDFVKNFGAAKTNFDKILRNCADAIFYLSENHSYYNPYDQEVLARLTGLPYDEDKEMVDTAAFAELRNTQPERTMLLLAYWLMEKEGRSYYEHKWVYEQQVYKNYWRDNPKLDRVYYFLEELGYQTSDEERQMRRGTHPLFDKEED